MTTLHAPAVTATPPGRAIRAEMVQEAERRGDRLGPAAVCWEVTSGQLSAKNKKPSFVTLADRHCVNTPIVADRKPPTCHLMWSRERELVPVSQIDVPELAPSPRGMRCPSCGLRGRVAGGREVDGLEGAGRGQVTRGPVASVRALGFPSCKVERF